MTTEPAVDLLYRAWTIIANAGEGDWANERREWEEAATRWRNDFHAFLDEHDGVKPRDD